MENYARGLAERLAGFGHSVSVFYPLLDEDGETGLLVEELGGVRAAGFRGGSRNFFEHLSEPRTEAAFADFISRGGFDVIHFQHTYHGLPFSLISLAAARSALVCLTLHDFWHICPLAHLITADGNICGGEVAADACAVCLAKELGLEESAAPRLSGFAARRRAAASEALAAASVVTAPSSYVLGAHARRFSLNGKAAVSPLGMAPVAEVPRRPANGRIRFTFMGRINRLKNLRAALDAMAGVSGPAELNVWGARADAREAQRLERAVKRDSRIRYRGAYDGANLPDVLSETDVGIVPSLTESFSLVAREYHAAGIPVLAARAGALPEAVGKGGILFDPYDAGELSGIMQAIVNDPGLIEKLSGGIRPVKSMEEDARQWERVYTENPA